MMLVMLSALVKSSFCRIETPVALVPGIRTGIPSLSQVKLSGRSPVATTHWTLVRSLTFRSLANANGVILGGTARQVPMSRCARRWWLWTQASAHKLIQNKVSRMCEEDIIS